MKLRLLLFAGTVTLLASCKETPPAIDFGPKASDTSYVATPESAQQRVVVIEEFTGVTCPNCPSGHKAVKALETANPGRVATLGIQINGFIQCNPVDDHGIKTRNDNRTQDGTDISDGIYNAVSSMPSAGVDRVVDNGNMLFPVSRWAAMVNNRLTVTPAANVTITSTYNASSRQAAIKVRVAYTSAVSKPQALTVAIVENNIVDAQEDGSNIIQDYIHQHVLRDILTAPTGNGILSSYATKQPGLVYERTFIYDVNPAWNVDECHIIAYVSNDQGADREVVQGAEAHLK